MGIWSRIHVTGGLSADTSLNENLESVSASDILDLAIAIAAIFLLSIISERQLRFQLIHYNLRRDYCGRLVLA